MAEIIHDSKHDRGRASAYMLGDTECGRDYIFLLHGNHIEVEPEGRDWRQDLTEKEKLMVFNRILGDFREERTVGDDGFKIASIGVSTDGRLYIGGNVGETQNSSAFHRGCAETRMLHISAERDAYEQLGARKKAQNQQEEFKPRFLKFDPIYVMGGQLPEIPIVAPCGDCTETLSKHMAPDARVVLLPVNDGSAELTLNKAAKYARDLKPNQAWDTTIGYLRPLHEIKVKPLVANMQRAAFDAMAGRISELLAAGETHLASAQLPQNFAKPVLGSVTARLLQEQSLPEAPPLSTLNAVLYNQIEAAAYDRVRGILNKRGDSDYSIENVKAVMASEIKNIRAVALQTDSGKLYSGLAVASSIDKAGISAEIQAAGNANREMGSQGVLRVVSMEFAPEKIDKDVVRTSTKSSVERLVKRRSKLTHTVDFKFLPLNGGDLSDTALNTIKHHHTAEELFPGYFTGKASQRATTPELKQTVLGNVGGEKGTSRR